MHFIILISALCVRLDLWILSCVPSSLCVCFAVLLGVPVHLNPSVGMFLSNVPSFRRICISFCWVPRNLDKAKSANSQTSCNAFIYIYFTRGTSGVSGLCWFREVRPRTFMSFTTWLQTFRREILFSPLRAKFEEDDYASCFLLQSRCFCASPFHGEYSFLKPRFYGSVSLQNPHHV